MRGSYLDGQMYILSVWHEGVYGVLCFHPECSTNLLSAVKQIAVR